MSRDFRYKTSQAVRNDARRLGLEQDIELDLGPLKAPVEIGGRTVGDRMA